MSNLTKFGDLPVELRSMVWKLLLQDKRTVVIQLQNPHDVHSGFKTLAPVPALLHVNREAREEAKQVYTLCFGMNDEKANVYFNHDLDTLSFPSWDWHVNKYGNVKDTYLDKEHHFSGLAMINDISDFKRVRYFSIDIPIIKEDRDAATLTQITKLCARLAWFFSDHLQSLEIILALPKSLGAFEDVNPNPRTVEATRQSVRETRCKSRQFDTLQRVAGHFEEAFTRWLELFEDHFPRDAEAAECKVLFMRASH